VADPEIVGGGCGRVAGGMKGVDSPPHVERGLGRGCSPFPEFFSHFGPQNGQFRCIVGDNFYSSAACVTRKYG